jgi:hypothetical protein
MYLKLTKQFFKCFTILTCFSISIIQAQVDTLWTKTFGGNSYDCGYSVQQTTDDGFIITGYTESFGAGMRDVWLIKTTGFGDTLWTRAFGGPSDDQAYSINQNSDGGFIITGYTLSFGAGMYDVWLIKLDASGDTLWTKTFGGSNDDLGLAVQQTTDEGYILAGYTSSFGDGLNDVWLIKTNSSGDTLWTKTYGVNGDELGYFVQQTEDEGYIIAGEYTTSIGIGTSDIWLIKTDASGDTLWTKTFGGEFDDNGHCVQQTSDGGYIITGSTLSFGAGVYDIWLIKTDASGDTLWTKTYGARGDEQGYSVQQTLDEGYIITGFKRVFGINNTNIWLIKTDASGNQLWTKTFGGSKDEQGYSVKQTSDGGYIVTGFTTPLGSDYEDVWMIKTTPDVNSVKNNNINIPSADALFQNYPNPFNPATTISYGLPLPGHVLLQVYDLRGREVATLVNENLNAGSHTAIWNAAGFASGVYLYRLQVGEFEQVRKMILLR